MSDLCDSIKRHVSVEELRSFLLNLCTCTSGEDVLILADDPVLSKKLNATTTIHQMFDFVSMNCANFLHYDVFEEIVLKTDAKLLTKLAEAIDLQGEVAKIWGVKHYTLHLFGIKEGGTELTFTVFISVAKKV